jgi:hypothetical protein
MQIIFHDENGGSFPIYHIIKWQHGSIHYDDGNTIGGHRFQQCELAHSFPSEYQAESAVLQERRIAELLVRILLATLSIVMIMAGIDD